MTAKQKVALVTTSILQVKFFLEPLLLELNKHYDITLIVKNDHPEIKLNSEIKTIYAPIERKINLIQDLYGLFYLCFLFLKHRFIIVHSVNPKAGLLAMTAAYLTARPNRIHTFQGEVWSNKRGLYKFILKTVDKVTAFCSTGLTVISPTERAFLIKENIFPEPKSIVLANGSICGIDTHKFQYSEHSRRVLRSNLGLNNDAVVFLYIGRLTADKGIIDLVDAYLLLIQHSKEKDPPFYLLFAGPDEEEMTDQIANAFHNKTTNYKILPYTENPQEIIGASDVLVLPSHREGLGNVLLEAAAMGVPSIGSNIYGISDAIVDESTGLLFKVKDAGDLFHKMKILLMNSNLRSQLGANAKSRILKDFTQELVLRETVSFYKETLLNSK